MAVGSQSGQRAPIVVKNAFSGLAKSVGAP
jgi:hypothetical protein